MMSVKSRAQQAKVAKPKQLRNRPFMIITHMYSPAKNESGKMPPTHVKDWINKKLGEIAMSEIASFADRIDDSTMTTASVIIDLLDSKIVKNRQAPVMKEDGVLMTQKEVDDAVVNFFMEKYAEKASECLWAYFRKYGLGSQPIEINAKDAAAIEQLREAAKLHGAKLVPTDSVGVPIADESVAPPA
jgi:hypothetical protein